MVNYTCNIKLQVGGDKMFAEKVKRMREKNKLTQKDVADFIGVTYVAVGKWETGKGMPRAAVLPKLAKLYKCTVGDFF